MVQFGMRIMPHPPWRSRFAQPRPIPSGYVVVQSQSVRLCVVERTFRSRSGPGSTRVVEGTCPDGRCSTGVCRTLRVCADPSVGTGGQSSEEVPRTPSPVRAGSAGVTQDGAEDLLPQKTRSEPPAPRLSRRPSESFGCASRWIPALLVAVVLAVGALLLLWRRRR